MYVGTYNKTPTPTFSVTVTPKHGDPYELPLCERWSGAHSWDNEYGVRQLALDLMLDFFGESPTIVQLQAKEDGTAAWFPHLAYFGELVKLVTTPTITHWELSRGQLTAWFEDWALSTHRTFSLAKYGPSYVGEPFAAWERRLATMLGQNGARSLPEIGVTRAWSWKAYLAGYIPAHVAYLWACEQNLALRRRLYPDTPMSVQTVWDTVPNPEDYPF